MHIHRSVRHGMELFVGDERFTWGAGWGEHVGMPVQLQR